MKPCKVYRGVKVYKEMQRIPGSDIKELKNGDLVPCIPKYEISYKYSESYPFSTLEECKKSIDDIWNKSLIHWDGIVSDTFEASFAEIMNN